MNNTSENDAGEPREIAGEELRSLLDSVSESQPLPASGTELILLEVDPHRAHAYWNIDTSQAHPDRPLVLRVHDITDAGASQPSQTFDVEVQGLQGRWYLDLWRDNRTFVSEIGYRQPDGSLSLLARSNEVHTPVAEPADAEKNGRHVDPSGQPLLTEWPGDRAPAEPQAAPSPAEVIEPTPTPVAELAPPPAAEVKEPVTILNPEFPLPEWVSASAEKPVADKPVEPRMEPVFTDTVMAAGDAAVAFAEEVIAAETAPELPSTPEPFFPAPEQLAAAITENHAALQAFYQSAEEQAVAYASDQVPSGEPAHTPAAEQGQPPPGTSGGIAPAELPPLERIVGLSSLEHMKKDVLLEINAEVHIYGRSQPNTELSLYGQVVKTRPDGTFSVRRPLPHGALILPLLYTKPEP